MLKWVNIHSESFFSVQTRMLRIYCVRMPDLDKRNELTWQLISTKEGGPCLSSQLCHLLPHILTSSAILLTPQLSQKKAIRSSLPAH